MLPSGVPGEIGLEADTVAKGRVPFTGWLMLREIRRFVPREPRYPMVMAICGPSCRCTFTFQDCSDAFRNRGSIVAGARPTGRVTWRAVATGTDPAAASGAANGGLP